MKPPTGCTQPKTAATAPRGAWRTAPRPPDLTGEDVHVWSASIDHPAAVVRGWSDILSSDEQHRARRFRFERDRNRFIAARATLRKILAWCSGRDPRTLSFGYGRFGKPELTGDSEITQIAFNVSHSHNRALIAVSHGRKVGIDLEFVRPIGDLMLVAGKSFSARVNAKLRSLPAGEDIVSFFTFWTRTEALLKAIGHGFSSPLDEFDVSGFENEAPCLIPVPVNQREGKQWSLLDLDPHSEYAAALAAEGRDWRLHTWLWPTDRRDP